MKKIVFIVMFLFAYQAFPQNNNISFFDGSSFVLEYFLVNGEQEDLVLNHPTGSGFFSST